MDPKSRRPSRDKLMTRWGSLKTERASWMSHWQDLSDHLLPRSGRFFVSDRNKGNRKHNNIYDSTGTRALRVLGAGLMAGATSPARRWFKLRVAGDPELNNFPAVKVWLEDVTRLMESVYQKSNTYRALHSIYEEIGCYGTGVSIVMPSFDNVIHHYPLTAGEYALAGDFRGNVTTLYREFDMTVAQIVGEFGYEACSHSVRQQYDQGSPDTWVTLIHAIEPRTDRDAKKADAKNMPWASYYFEVGGDPEKVLRESGFRRFPALCPRWSAMSGDVYGSSPAMDALGDIRQLQHQQLRKAQAIDYQTKPPLQVPSSLKNREVDMLPGGITYYDQAAPQTGIRSMWEVGLSLDHLLMDIQDVRARIDGAFYADLFLMLAGSDKTQMTATEVAERHEEKLLMLGPVLERLHTELLAPLIEMTFDQLTDAQLLPPPPQELQEMELDVEFVSMLAQAQRAVGANSVDRWLASVGAVAQMKPDVLDKVDSDYWAETYADMLGVDPRMVVPDEQVAEIRQQRAEQQAQAEQLAQAEQESKIVGNMAKAQQQNSGLGMEQFMGYGGVV